MSNNEPEFCMTEIPKDLAGFALLETHEVYDSAYWNTVAEKRVKENACYEAMCSALQLDPDNGRSTMSWSEMHKPFTM